MKSHSGHPISNTCWGARCMTLWNIPQNESSPTGPRHHSHIKLHCWETLFSCQSDKKRNQGINDDLQTELFVPAVLWTKTDRIIGLQWNHCSVQHQALLSPIVIILCKVRISDSSLLPVLLFLFIVYTKVMLGVQLDFMQMLRCLQSVCVIQVSFWRYVKACWFAHLV